MATIDLTDDDSQTWMNQVRAERVKGSSLTEAERARILRGRAWYDVASDAAQGAPVAPTAARWRFSDGTTYELGGEPQGPSAERLECTLAEAAEGAIPYVWGPMPGHSEPLDLTSLVHVDYLMRCAATPGEWDVVERPEGTRDPRNDERGAWFDDEPGRVY
jgi:hypothetical protein